MKIAKQMTVAAATAQREQAVPCHSLHCRHHNLANGRICIVQAERDLSNARINEARAEVARVVATGKCPQCGATLRNNTSLAGWWQCSQFGAVGFRADSTKPACDWQGFTK